MKKYFYLFCITFVLWSLASGSVFAWLPDVPQVDVPNVNLILPTSTPTPTLGIQIRAPLKIIPPAQPTSTPTSIPSTTPVVSPTVTVQPVSSIEPSIQPTGTSTGSTTLEQPTQATTSQSQTQPMTKKDIALFGLIGVILLLLVGQPLWPKIKEWLHKKTE